MPTKTPPKKSKPQSSIALVPYGQLKEQYELPLDQVRKMIKSQTKLSDETLMLALATARMFGVPLQGINVIPSQQGPGIYINSDGIRWLVHNNPRGLQTIETEITHRPSKDENWAEVKCRTTFEDGSHFDGVGACMVDKDWNAANAIMKAETKAERRAGYKATGKVLPSYEDYKEYIEYREREIKDITPQSKNGFEQVNSNEPPKTLVELITRSALGIDELRAKLGVSEISEIKDFAAAWEKVKPQEVTE